jgi:ubiquinone/menaquinone biosynthesis C-methylase UbiE
MNLWSFMCFPRVPEAVADEQEASIYESQAAEKYLAANVRRIVKRVLRRSQLRQVVDIGTGPGQIPVLLAQSDSSVSVVGADLSEAMLELARENATRAGVESRARPAGVPVRGPELKK